jgi:hypothetical protein
MTARPGLAEQRQVEYEAATNELEWHRLGRRWAKEDAAYAAAEDWRTQTVLALQAENKALRRRLERLEKREGLVPEPLMKALGAVVARIAHLPFGGDLVGAGWNDPPDLQEMFRPRAPQGAKTLEQRIEDLERSQLKFSGVYTPGERYARNSLVTKGGSLWCALMDTDGPPPGSGWQLAVKEGAAK